MRKRKVLNIIPVLAAWSIILLHGIIPHNHADHAMDNCKVLHHSHESLVSYSTCSCDDDESVCHFTTNLISQDQQVYFFPETSEFIEQNIILSLAFTIPEFPPSINGPPPVISGYSFRAPPLV